MDTPYLLKMATNFHDSLSTSKSPIPININDFLSAPPPKEKVVEVQAKPESDQHIAIANLDTDTIIVMPRGLTPADWKAREIAYRAKHFGDAYAHPPYQPSAIESLKLKEMIPKEDDPCLEEWALLMKDDDLELLDD